MSSGLCAKSGLNLGFFYSLNAGVNPLTCGTKAEAGQLG